AASTPPAQPAPSPAPPLAAASSPAPQAAGDKHEIAHASPGVRRFARELGVDVARVHGSGPKSRILKEDVQGFVKALLAGTSAPAAARAGTGAGLGLPDWPKVDFAKYGPVEIKALTRIQKISGPALARNWVMVP